MDVYSLLVIAQAAAFANLDFTHNNQVDNVKAARVSTKTV